MSGSNRAEATPSDAALRARLRDAERDPDVGAVVTAALGDEGDLARSGASVRAIAIVVVGTAQLAVAGTLAWWNVRGGSPLVPAAAVAAGLVVTMAALVVVLRSRRHDPRRIALQRGLGVNACVSCGHAIAGSAPSATCPECGYGHEAFPLGWIDDRVSA